jgi:O-methyltransferase
MKEGDQGAEDMFDEARRVFFGAEGAALEPNASSARFLETRNEPNREVVIHHSLNRRQTAQPFAPVDARAKPSLSHVRNSRGNINLLGTLLKNRLKTNLLRLSYWLAYHLAAPAVYSRQPFVRYPYMYPPSEIIELTKQLLSIEVPGAAVEVGCNQGWTTCFLVEALAERGVHRDYVCIDTFTGFTPRDVAVEYESRGKAVGIYDHKFTVNDPQWLKASLKRFGYSNVNVRVADATTFDYRALGTIAFALVDVDLYRPVRESLNRIIPHMAKGGMVVVDDCDNAKDSPWDGAYQAFMEFCEERNIMPEIVCQKLGIIRT